jgi:hypothetical protein
MRRSHRQSLHEEGHNYRRSKRAPLGETRENLTLAPIETFDRFFELLILHGHHPLRRAYDKPNAN